MRVQYICSWSKDSRPSWIRYTAIPQRIAFSRCCLSILLAFVSILERAKLRLSQASHTTHTPTNEQKNPLRSVQAPTIHPFVASAFDLHLLVRLRIVLRRFLPYHIRPRSSARDRNSRYFRPSGEHPFVRDGPYWPVAARSCLK